MKPFNIIIVLHHDDDAVLMCKRTKEPYLGLYNFVGGKQEPGETALEGAYRELCEETGISGEDIALLHLMDLTYPLSDCEVKVYAGKLRREVSLTEEAHRLYWLDIAGSDFFDLNRFGGDGDIGHMMAILRQHCDQLPA